MLEFAHSSGKNLYQFLRRSEVLRLHRQRRWKSTASEIQIFDRKAKTWQKEAALRHHENELCYYLKDEVGYRLYDNLCDITRKFDTIVDLSCGRGSFAKHIGPETTNELIMCESSAKLLEHCVGPKDGVRVKKMIVDEEKLPFTPNSIDVIVSNLSLHWVNDLPCTFYQVFHALKNDGVFLGSLFGGETLYELRSALQLAEMERHGGVSSHVSPLTRVQDIGNILNQSGFTLQTMDADEIIVGYPSLFELMSDLKGMGENNATIRRCSHLSRDTMLAAAAIYENMYGEEGKIRATFQLINFISWKPDPSQPKPIRRGSAEFSLKDIDKLNKIIKKKGHIDLNEVNKKSTK